MNTPRRKPLARRAERAAAAAVGCVPIRSASFVSVLISANAVRQTGLPIADYFLWNDDFEFTTRLLRDRAGLLCPASVVEHRTRTFGASDSDPGPRFELEVRNKIWLLMRSAGLRPVERTLYATATVCRWARTIARSHDRRVLWRGLRAGIAAAGRPPRPNDVVLREVELRPNSELR